jgi:DNA-binding protein HU-beta
MNKADLVTDIAKTTGQNKTEVHSVLAAFLHVVTGALSKGERVTLIGFGTFERRQRQARVGVNPQNPKQKLSIAAARVPAFRAGQELKDVVDGKTKLATPNFHPTAAKSKPSKPAVKSAPTKKSTVTKKKKR